MVTENNEDPQGLDATTFQKPLGELATTIALKVQREGPKLLLEPTFTAIDIYVMLRQASQIYGLFFFLNADWRREEDPDWKWAYAAAPLPLIRTMIDCLYNITAILNEPALKGRQFRESGYKKILDALDADEKRYGGDPRWDAYIAERRGQIDLDMRRNGLDLRQVQAAKTWPTLSRYLRVKNGIPLTPTQEFLKKLTFGFWDEYSAIAHATFQGLVPIAPFFTPSDIPHEERPKFDDRALLVTSFHLSRVAAILLCMLTEVQVYFRFDGAHINQRLHRVWDALMPVPEIKELYDERYGVLMKDRGINPD